MVSLSQSTVTLISTIIGIITAISPFLISTIYNEIFENPNLVLRFTPNINDNYNKSEVKITNIGMESVTNLSITIQSPLIIKSIINNFSTVPITFVNLNNGSSESLNLNQVLNIEEYHLNVFKLNVPILRQGGGDTIIFQIETTGNQYQ
jgi:hypothetical protein